MRAHRNSMKQLTQIPMSAWMWQLQATQFISRPAQSPSPSLWVTTPHKTQETAHSNLSVHGSFCASGSFRRQHATRAWNAKGNHVAFSRWDNPSIHHLLMPRPLTIYPVPLTCGKEVEPISRQCGKVESTARAWHRHGRYGAMLRMWRGGGFVFAYFFSLRCMFSPTMKVLRDVISCMNSLLGLISFGPVKLVPGQRPVPCAPEDAECPYHEHCTVRLFWEFRRFAVCEFSSGFWRLDPVCLPCSSGVSLSRSTKLPKEI